MWGVRLRVPADVGETPRLVGPSGIIRPVTVNAAAPSGRRGLLAGRGLPLALFGVCFTVFALTGGYRTTSGDLWATDFGSWLLVTFGNQNVAGHSMPLDPDLLHIWVHTLDNGDQVIARSAGVIAAGLPAYALLGTDTFSVVPGVLTAAFVTALTVVLVFGTVTQVLSRRHAALGAIAFAFTTPVWSVAANDMWPHTLTVFGISGMAWAATKDRWLLVGLFAIVCVWARPQTAVLVLVVGALVAVSRRDARPALKVGLVSAIGLVALGWWNYVTFNTFSPLGPYDPKATLALVDDQSELVNQLGMWVSPDKGFLVWTPIVLVMLPAVRASWRGLPDWSRALVWAGLTYTLVHAHLVEFTGGEWFYGYRYTLELLACLTPAFLMSTPALGPIARRIVPPVLGLQAGVILVGAVMDVLRVPSEDVWRNHSFVAEMSAAPVMGAIVILASMGAGALVARIWAQPPAEQTARETVSL